MVDVEYPRVITSKVNLFSRPNQGRRIIGPASLLHICSWRLGLVYEEPLKFWALCCMSAPSIGIAHSSDRKDYCNALLQSKNRNYTTWRQLGRDNRNDILVQVQIGSYTIFVVSRLLLGKARFFCTRNLFLFSAFFDENIRRSVLLHHDRHGGGGVQVGLDLLLRGLQRQLSCQHSHHCQL